MEIVLTDDNLKETINSSDSLLVDFYADWCGPCKAMSPIVDELEKKYMGRVQVGKINVDKNRKACRTYHVSSIPTFLFFHGGELVDKSVGMMTKLELEEKIEKIL